MALGPRLDLKQSQSLVMTPQLQQSIKLLALSNLEIEAFIGEALDSNPLLDLVENPRDAADPAAMEDFIAPRETALETSNVDTLIREGMASHDQPLDIDPSSLDQDHDTGKATPFSETSLPNDWGAGDTGNAYETPNILEHAAAEETLQQHLEAQIGLYAHSSFEAEIVLYLIGLLDDAGYLALSLKDIAHESDWHLPDLEHALRCLQQFSPTGIGARSLSECIALQAREADRYDPAMALLIENLDLVARNEFTRLKKLCSVDDEDFTDMLTELRNYNPRPGSGFGPTGSEPVVPDILINARSDGGWDIGINEATLPRLIVNRSYYLELKAHSSDKTSRAWLSEKLTDANWLIKALDQRQKTMLKVASKIVELQEGFFRYGVAHLKPLTLKTVAEAIEMHESTISRATAHKYLMCDRGTFELKHFFTSGVASSSGDGTASAEAVKAAIRQLIDAEEPKAILSDDALVELLKARGFDLARRTVAKYREAIGLGSSVQRRRQKALAAMR